MSSPNFSTIYMSPLSRVVYRARVSIRVRAQTITKVKPKTITLTILIEREVNPHSLATLSSTG